jgi:copper homeostasis protein
MLLEACVDTLQSAINAERGGADRVELCADLADAGTTPSHATLLLALERLHIPVFPIIRPRGGGFVYADADIEVMRADLRHARDLGATGAVVGALTQAGEIAADVVALLRGDAPDMQLTFHRAFDASTDAGRSLETLIRLGIDRVLTSGQRATAWEGREVLAALLRQAAGRIAIVAAGGITATNVAALVGATGVTEVHVRGTSLERDAGPLHHIAFRKLLPADESVRAVTDAGRIMAIRAAGSQAAVSRENGSHEP